MKYKNGSKSAANANNLMLSFIPISLRLSMPSLLFAFTSLKNNNIPKKTQEIISLKNIVAVGFKYLKTWVDHINDNPQKTMAMTPLKCTKNFLSFIMQK